MKNSIFLILLSLSINSCTITDETIILDNNQNPCFNDMYFIEILNLKAEFDHQDNVVFINNQWLQNWDNDNNEPANPYLSYYVDSNNSLILISKEYKIYEVEIIDPFGYFPIYQTIPLSCNSIKFTSKGIIESILNDSYFIFKVKLIEHKNI